MSLLAGVHDGLSHLFARRYATMFGTAKVYTTSWQNTRIRVLDIDDTYQSATYLDNRWCDVPFPYLALYDEAFNAEQEVRSVCMLGGGGYAFPKHVVAHRPQARIDVVEIDPAITRLAHEQFFLDRLEEEYGTQKNGRLRTFCTDATNHLSHCVAEHIHYDAIMNDCFAGHVAEDSLATPAGIELVHASLSSGGLYLTNIITALEGSEAGPLMRLVALLSDHFRHVAALTCDRSEPDERDNVVVVASDRDPQLRAALRLYDAS